MRQSVCPLINNYNKSYISFKITYSLRSAAPIPPQSLGHFYLLIQQIFPHLLPTEFESVKKDFALNRKFQPKPKVCDQLKDYDGEIEKGFSNTLIQYAHIHKQLKYFLYLNFPKINCFENLSKVNP